MSSATLFPWQKTQWELVAKRACAQTLPHAHVLCGPAGLGKRAFAELMAHHLLCENNTDTNSFFCGKCRACQLFAAQTHPDLLMIEPLENSRAIKIDQVRFLVEWSGKTAQQGRCKVIILDPADSMNGAAMNALLKTLEEPTPNTYLLLVTTTPALLPATIRSRCQKISFVPPPEFMQSNHPQLHQQVAENLRAICEKRQDPLQIAAHTMQYELSSLVSALIYCVMQIILLRNVSQKNDLNAEIKVFFDHIGILKKYTLHADLFSYLDKLYEVRRQLLQQANYNAQLLLEDLFCRWENLC